MNTRYSSPPLLLVNDDSEPSYVNIFHIASSYNISAKLILKESNSTVNPALLFPSIVCQSFAIELFLKFFIIFNLENNLSYRQKQEIKGHKFSELWMQIPKEHQELISLHYSNAPKPSTISGGFADGLNTIGDNSFTKWRYVYEIPNFDFMHLDHTNLISDVLRSAATYGVMETLNKSK